MCIHNRASSIEPYGTVSKLPFVVVSGHENKDIGTAYPVAAYWDNGNIRKLYWQATLYRWLSISVFFQASNIHIFLSSTNFFPIENRADKDFF